MPLGEVTGVLLAGIFRLLIYFFIEIVLEILIKGLGYLVCRPFAKSVDPDGIVVTIVGLSVWVVIILLMYSGYGYISNQVNIDSCLDSGGRYNYELQKCVDQNF